jgi:septum formation protein
VAAVVQTEEPQCLVLAADTVVAQGRRLLAKPADAADATRMLRILRDRPHQVLSGICLLDLASGIGYTAVNTTLVSMRRYTDDEIAAYVATGDPLDKAGGYAIQDRIFRPVARFEGCYAGVMGLPVADLILLLRKVGLNLPLAPAAVCSRHGAPECCSRSPLEAAD